MKITAFVKFITFLSFCFLLLPTSLVFAFGSPELELPANDSLTDDTSPTLKWNWNGTCTTSGSCFLVQVSNQQDLSSIEKSTYTNLTSYTPQKLAFGTWYWRVKAKDDNNQWSLWSEVWSFTIVATSPPPKTILTGNPVLNEFMPYPESGEEWAEIYNNSTEAADLTDWQVDDGEGGSSPTTIPAGTTVAPFGYFVLYFSSKLNNSGDTIRLINSQGALVETYTYTSPVKGQSFAKDKNSVWFISTNPSPGATNPDPPTKPVQPIFSKKSSKDNSAQNPTAGNKETPVESANQVLAASTSSPPKKVSSVSSAPTNKNNFNYLLLGAGLVLILLAGTFGIKKSGFLPFGKKPLPIQRSS